MAEPLKNRYSSGFIERLTREIESVYPKFASDRFTSDVFDENWGDKELKDRMGHIAQNLHKHLPKTFGQAVDIFKQAIPRFDQGFEIMFFPDFVERYGMDEYELSIDALEYFTPYASSEFAVRPFIQRYPKRMMTQMKRWAGSENENVRRLATEGCRPRLPWAMALPQFKKDPAPVMRILEMLKADPSEYVRRSVANNLNDISKDNPAIVIQIAKSWIGRSPETDWMVKHACRTLLKAGNREVLRFFGYSAPDGIKVETFEIEETVEWGGTLGFSFALSATGPSLGKLRIEYGLDFMKSNGRTARKVFKISESEVAQTRKSIQRRHSFRYISTRKYYPGLHGLAIIVNGQEIASAEFVLLEPRKD